VLSKRTMAQIGGDDESAEWESDRPAARGKLKAPWLAKAVAKLDQKQRMKRSPQKVQGSSAEKKTKNAKLRRS